MKLNGTHIAYGETLTRLGSGATFEPADKIAAFYLANRDRPTVVKRLIETHVDAALVHAEDYPPIG